MDLVFDHKNLDATLEALTFLRENPDRISEHRSELEKLAAVNDHRLSGYVGITLAEEDSHDGYVVGLMLLGLISRDDPDLQRACGELLPKMSMRGVLRAVFFASKEDTRPSDQRASITYTLGVLKKENLIFSPLQWLDRES